MRRLPLERERSTWDEWVAALLTARGRDAALASLISRVDGWEPWCAEARARRLSGAIWTAIRDEGLQAAIPVGAAARLEGQWRQSVAASALVHLDLSQIGAALDKEKIPWALLKGPSVADILYSDPGSRPMSDIDILIRPHFFRKSLDVLAEEGWRLREDMIPEYLRITHAVMLKFDPCVAMLEVHWNLLGTVPLPGEDVLWDGLERMEIAGRAVPVLGAADSALHLALHAVLHHGLKEASHLLDIALAFARLDREGWGIVVDHATRLNVVEELLAALDAAKRRVGFAAPEQIVRVLKQRRPGWLRRRATALALADSGGHAAMTLSRLIMMDGWENKGRYLDFVLMPPREWLRKVDSGSGGGAYSRRAFSGIGRALVQMFRARRAS